MDILKTSTSVNNATDSESENKIPSEIESDNLATLQYINGLYKNINIIIDPAIIEQINE